MGKTIRGFNGQPSEPDYPLPADLPFSVAPTQDNGSRALAERLQEVMTDTRRSVDYSPLAAAILANGAAFLPAAAELERLRAAETAALRLLNGFYHHDGETCANKTDVAALRAALAPERGAGAACRCGTNVRQGIRHYWCLTHDAEWLPSTMACARAAELDGETEPCPTCWQPVPVPQRGDHDYGIPLRPDLAELDRLRAALERVSSMAAEAMGREPVHTLAVLSEISRIARAVLDTEGSARDGG